MPRWFNTAGPCQVENHYMVPVASRMPDVHGLVERKSYFVVHAPRQIGKTTTLVALAAELTASGKYTAALVSMEVGAPFGDQIELAENAVLGTWRRSLQSDLPKELWPPPWPEAAPGERIGAALTAWAKASQRPLVVFLDEIDALQDDALVSVLRQLRDGYRSRPDSFPSSLALVGLRDIRDYRVRGDEREHLGTASPFNISVESLTLKDFTPAEVAELFAQHTADTGQAVPAETLARIYHWSRGQPWLVNALGRQLMDVLVTDRAKPMQPADVDAAARILIERQDTHLDSLSERLREPRVRAIVEPMVGGANPQPLPNDDVRYVLDLGLLRRGSDGTIEVSNPIYKEIIVRDLLVVPRISLPKLQPSWLTPAGKLDAQALLAAFIKFWRRHGEPVMRSAPYHEIAPHLVMMAFLDRVANGGGTVEREYAIGSGRLDLCLRLGGESLAIELKVWREHEPDPREEGLEQLDAYLAGLGLPVGWLVIFDRRPGLPRLSERTTVEDTRTPGGREVRLIRA
ncbi:MAG TPA: hypothetical protein VGB85_07320 [Nannocystis sp.]|jgi:hypothetical protein